MTKKQRAASARNLTKAQRRNRDAHRRGSEHLKRWAQLKLRITAADETASAARRDLTEFVRNHLLSRPLGDEVKTKLLARVKSGQGLCCTAGAKWLRTVVDPVWAEVIDGWAYEALGCSPGPRDRDYWYRALVAKIERDDWSVDL